MSARSDHRAAPVLFNGGVRLREWIEAGGSPARHTPLAGFRLRWSGFWFERHAAITERKCAQIDLPANPVFVLGLWRTGSTVLHGLLAEATPWTTPRTWQCFRPADFLLARPPRQRQVRRLTDEGYIRTFSPQEDEFATLLLGEPSLYRAFIDPRRMEEAIGLLEQWRHGLKPTVEPLSDRWETFLKAVIAYAPGRLLLKSPNHTFRLPWLADRFPDAQFIWVTRPVPDVFASNRRMWTAMIERYGLWHHQTAALEAFLRAAIRNHDELLDWARSALSERIYVVPFQEVIQNGPSLVSRYLDRLGSRPVRAPSGAMIVGQHGAHTDDLPAPSPAADFD
jgi:omega-hydroxy-beta-dihydromenaquinone-9 sulfotransferase